MTVPTAEWPSRLDALEAAPSQHRLLLENERVRVLDTRIEPGERTPLHTHRWPAVHYFLSWSDFVRRGPSDEVLLDSRALSTKPSASSTLWGEPLAAHTLENVGTGPLHVISMEIKPGTP